MTRDRRAGWSRSVSQSLTVTVLVTVLSTVSVTVSPVTVKRNFRMAKRNGFTNCRNKMSLSLSLSNGFTNCRNKMSLSLSLSNGFTVFELIGKGSVRMSVSLVTHAPDEFNSS